MQAVRNGGKPEKKKRAVRRGSIAAAAACMMIAVTGASAYFTDTDQIYGTINTGTFDMRLTDMSDLDGNYRAWSERLTSTTKLTVNGQQSDSWTLPSTADAEKKRAASTGIINPGDTGILAFKVENVAEKSMDTAAVVTVEVELPKGSYDDVKRDGTTKVIVYDADGKSLTASSAVAGVSATYNIENAKAAVDSSKNQKALALLADTTTDQGKADAGSYTIEGLGTPVVYQGRFERDTRGEYTDHLIDTDKNVLTLRYYTTLESLYGSVEKEASTDGEARNDVKDDSHGAKNSAIYAYNVDFDRAVTNKFQNATMLVNVDVYAKQHRDSTVSSTDFMTIDGYQGSAAVPAGTDVAGAYNETGAAQTAKVVGMKGVDAESEVNVPSGDTTEHSKAVMNTGGTSAVRSNCNQTHVVSAKVPTIDLSSDWSMIGSFSHVIGAS